MAAYSLGPEKKTFTANIEDELQQSLAVPTTRTTTSLPSLPSRTEFVFDDTICTYNWVKQTLEAEYPGKFCVFCHDQAYCLGNRYQDLPSGYRHTFLIRHPHKLFPSWKKGLVKLIPSYKQRPFSDCPMLPPKYGYGELHDLMVYLQTSGAEAQPIIIDADDLQENPEGILRQYCHLLGLPYNEQLIYWDSGGEVTKSWIISKTIFEYDIQHVGFFEEALKSCQFHPPSAIPGREELDADLVPLIDASMPYYMKLHSLRIKP